MTATQTFDPAAPDVRGSEQPDARRSEEFARVRQDFQQYQYPVPSTRTSYGVTGARSTPGSTLMVRAE